MPKPAQAYSMAACMTEGAYDEYVKVYTGYDALLVALADLRGVARQAMREANNDGAEWDIEAELAEASALLKRLQK